MSATFWQCFGMGQKSGAKEMHDVYSKDESDSAIGSSSSSIIERNSVHSLPCTSTKVDYPERLTHSFEAIPGSSTLPISTYENPLFVPIPLKVKRKLRILMAGDHRVGKSCLLLRFLYNGYITRYNRTTEVIKSVLRKHDNEYYYLQIIDLGGDRVKEKQPEELINEVDGIIFVYSTENANSVTALEETAGILKYENLNHVIPSILLGNKSDLKREVSCSKGQSLARQLNSAFAEVSAKTGDGTKDIFAEFIEKLMSLQVDEREEPIRDRISRRTI